MRPYLIRNLVAAIALSVGLSACGGGGGSAGAAPTPPDLAFNSLARKRDRLTDDDIRHFLGRTHFGVRQAEADDLRGRGLSQFVDRMIGADFDAAFEAAALDATVELDDRIKPSSAQLERWWLWIMMNTEQPFREAMAMFWHDHFATGTSVLSESERRWYFDHVNLIRSGPFGTLRQFLFDIATDNTMLDWLDGFRSRDGSINENFARELWELFTLGADNGYTQADIEESARCFTGFDDQDDPVDDTLRIVVYDPDRHDEGDKIIFGQTIVGRVGDDAINEYWDVIDLTLANQPVAEFIVKKLWEYFVYLDPPQEVIDDLAATFRGSGYDLSALYKRIFKSEAFFSTRAKEGIVKSPVDYGVGFIRSTGLQIEPFRLEDGLTASGQRPTRPPNVAGWEQNELWFSAQAAVERANIVVDCIEGRSYQEDLGIDIVGLLPPGVDANTPPTAGEVLDGMSLLLDVDLTPAERDQLVTYMNSDADDDQIVPDPFDATNSTHVDERVRGVLFILSQHPTYHVR